MTPRKAILLGIGAAVLVGGLIVVIVMLAGGPGSPSGAGSVDAAREPVARPEIPCVVRVNEARAAQLDPGSPMYPQCVFTNPLAARSITLPLPEQIQPVVRQRGAAVALAWRMVGRWPMELPPQGRAICTWQANGTLPVGVYEATVTLPTAFPATAPDLDGVSIEPARVTVLDLPPDDSRNGLFRRRLLLLAGRNNELLATLRATVTTRPDDLSMRIELVDALDAAGAVKEAHRELLEVGYRIGHPAPGRKQPVPTWLALRLEDLAARAATHERTSGTDSPASRGN